MDVNEKYRRWGWGAVIGLVGVILIAGLIVAISMSSPKPSADGGLVASSKDSGNSGDGSSGSAGSDSSNSNQGDTEESSQKSEAEKRAEEARKAEAEKKAAEEKAEQEKAEQEKAEREAAEKAEREANEKKATERSNNLPHTGPTESLTAVVAFAVIAYLFALNVVLVKKQMR